MTMLRMFVAMMQNCSGYTAERSFMTIEVFRGPTLVTLVEYIEWLFHGNWRPFC